MESHTTPRSLQTGTTVALDLETTTLRPESGAILAVGTARKGPETAPESLQVRGMTLRSPECLRRLKGLLSGSAHLVVHDVRMEGSWAEGFLGIRLKGSRVTDTKLLANRVLPGQPANLAALVSRYLPEMSGYKADTDGLIREGRITEVPHDDLLRRVAVDAWSTYRLKEILEPLLISDARPWLAEDVDLALCVERMSQKGMVYDEEEAIKLKTVCEEAQEKVRKELGCNPGSSVQVAERLAGAGVVLPRSAKDNPEADELTLRGVLESAASDDAKRICNLVLEYRGAQKLRTTYVEGYARRRNSDGRLRTDLFWPGTISWRLSSSNPNLQNVPRNARSLFRAREGCVLLEADYAQAELRISAALAGEHELINIFKLGGDPHGLFTRVLYGPCFTKEQRHVGKTGNFQLRYGAHGQGFQNMLAKEGKNLPIQECNRIVSLYWSNYRNTLLFRDSQYDILRSGGPLVSPTGGYRWNLEDAFLHTGGRLDEALLSAENSVIQSVPPRWALRAALRAEAEGITIVLNTHDGLLAEVPEADALSAGRRLGEIMTEVAAEDFMRGLPCPADVKYGKTWGDMKPLEVGQ